MASHAKKSLLLAARVPISSAAVSEALPLSLRHACPRTGLPVTHAATAFFFSRSNGRRAFSQSRVARQVQVEEITDIPLEDTGAEVDEDDLEAGEDDATAVQEKEAAEGGEEEDEAEEEDESESSSDSDSDEEPWSDYSDLENSYSTNSFDGISTRPFPREIRDKLLEKVDPQIIEIKPDGYLYLPEIQYRRILNNAFGPGGWALMPRTPLEIDPNTNIASREYALYAFGRFVSQAGGEQPLSDAVSSTTASEAAKSQALMRCCKDLGVASELWEPTFIREWKKVYAVQEWYEHVKTGKKTLLWRRRDRVLGYPYKESPPMSPSTAQTSQSTYGKTQSSYQSQQQQQAQPSYQPAYQPAQQQTAYRQQPPAPTKVAQPVRPQASAARPAAPAPPASGSANVPPASRPTLYTPYKSYTTRVSTNPMSATRPVHAPKPITSSPAGEPGLGHEEY